MTPWFRAGFNSNNQYASYMRYLEGPRKKLFDENKEPLFKSGQRSGSPRSSPRSPRALRTRPESAPAWRHDSPSGSPRDDEAARQKLGPLPLKKRPKTSVARQTRSTTSLDADDSSKKKSRRKKTEERKPKPKPFLETVVIDMSAADTSQAEDEQVSVEGASESVTVEQSRTPDEPSDALHSDEPKVDDNQDTQQQSTENDDVTAASSNRKYLTANPGEQKEADEKQATWSSSDVSSTYTSSYAPSNTSVCSLRAEELENSLLLIILYKNKTSNII